MILLMVVMMDDGVEIGMGTKMMTAKSSTSLSEIVVFVERARCQARQTPNTKTSLQEQ